MKNAIKILVVDDEPDFAQPMAFWLKSKGYAVLVAEDGQKAISAVKEDSPDIVLLDLNMPVMDGAEALKRIREFNKDIPVIVISAHVEDRRIPQIKPYGISGVFYKGAAFMEIMSLLEVALKTHKKLKEK